LRRLVSGDAGRREEIHIKERHVDYVTLAIIGTLALLSLAWASRGM